MRLIKETYKEQDHHGGFSNGYIKEYDIEGNLILHCEYDYNNQDGQVCKKFSYDKFNKLEYEEILIDYKGDGTVRPNEKRVKMYIYNDLGYRVWKRQTKIIYDELTATLAGIRVPEKYSWYAYDKNGNRIDEYGKPMKEFEHTIDMDKTISIEDVGVEKGNVIFRKFTDFSEMITSQIDYEYENNLLICETIYEDYKASSKISNDLSKLKYEYGDEIKKVREQIRYKYDENKRLISKETVTYRNGKPEMIKNQIDYEYQNNLLIYETIYEDYKASSKISNDLSELKYEYGNEIKKIKEQIRYKYDNNKRLISKEVIGMPISESRKFTAKITKLVSKDLIKQTENGESKYVLHNATITQDGPLKGKEVTCQRTLINSQGEEKEGVEVGQEVALYLRIVEDERGKKPYFEISLKSKENKKEYTIKYKYEYHKYDKYENIETIYPESSSSIDGQETSEIIIETDFNNGIKRKSYFDEKGNIFQCHHSKGRTIYLNEYFRDQLNSVRIIELTDDNFALLGVKKFYYQND